MTQLFVPSGTWASDGWGSGRVYAGAYGAVSTIGRGFSVAGVAGSSRPSDGRGDGRRRTWTVCPGRDGGLGASPPTPRRRKGDWQARRTNPQNPLPFTLPPAACGSGRQSEGVVGVGRTASSLSVVAPPTRGRRRHIAVSALSLIAVGIAAGILGWNAPGSSRYFGRRRGGTNKSLDRSGRSGRISTEG